MDVIHISDSKTDTYCVDCTKIVSEIFGDGLVSEALIRFHASNTLTYEQEIEKAALLASKIEELYAKSGNIWFDDNELVITFTNGNTVVIQGSEWGSVSKE